MRRVIFRAYHEPQDEGQGVLRAGGLSSAGMPSPREPSEKGEDDPCKKADFRDGRF